MNDTPCLVFDKGSHTSKLGFASESEPRLIQPTLVGKLKYDNKHIPLQSSNTSTTPFTYGLKAKSQPGLYTLSYPIQSKFSIDWNTLESLWSHFFTDDLMMPITDCNVLITEEDSNPKLNKRKLTQLFFEKFQVKGLCIVNPSLLSLMSIGKEKGIVIDSGDLLTTCVPIRYGYVIKNSITSTDVAGRLITEELIKGLKPKHPIVNNRAIGDSIKEKACYCSMTNTTTSTNTTPIEIVIENKTKEPYDYELPDGTVIEIEDHHRTTPTEILFTKETKAQGQSKGQGQGHCMTKGIQSQLHKAMCNISQDIEAENEYPLLLVGGTTLFKGFKERLKNEITAILPVELQYNFKLIDAADKLLSSWIGGTIYSNRLSSSNQWITKAMFDEKGVNAISDSFT